MSSKLFLIASSTSTLFLYVTFPAVYKHNRVYAIRNPGPLDSMRGASTHSLNAASIELSKGVVNITEDHSLHSILQWQFSPNCVCWAHMTKSPRVLVPSQPFSFLFLNLRLGLTMHQKSGSLCEHRAILTFSKIPLRSPILRIMIDDDLLVLETLFLALPSNILTRSTDM